MLVKRWSMRKVRKRIQAQMMIKMSQDKVKIRKKPSALKGG